MKHAGLEFKCGNCAGEIPAKTKNTEIQMYCRDCRGQPRQGCCLSMVAKGIENRSVQHHVRKVDRRESEGSVYA